MKSVLTLLLVGLVSYCFGQDATSSSTAKFHTYLITESMGIFPKNEGTLNSKLVQNLKSIGVMEDKKTSYEIKVSSFVFYYTYKGKSPIKFNVEGDEFPAGMRNNFFKNAKPGDKITIEEIKLQNGHQYKGPGQGVTKMEYLVK